MGKKHQRSRKKKAAASHTSSLAFQTEPYNFVPEAGVGCHICHFNAPWICGIEPFDVEDYDEGVAIPDIGISPEPPYVVAVINSTVKPCTFYLSLSHPCFDVNGKHLQMGWTRDEQGEVFECTTFILVLTPNTMMSVCCLESPLAGVRLQCPLEQVHEQLDSDIQELHLHPSAEEFDPAHTYIFPLEGDGPFLCTQGINGSLTHFFSGSYHAVDFRCPVGTPLLAVFDATVAEVRQSEAVSGIHVRNLFKWNSVMLANDDGTFVEYVHIKAGSVALQVGDRVVQGQQVCKTGDVGFCPEPHLHMQMHTSRASDAPTLKFALKAAVDGSAYFPEANKYYNGSGSVAQGQP